MRNPPPQHTAATTPALRGPSRSTQRPHTAAEEPRKTKNSVNIQPSVLIFQSQDVATRRPQNPMPAGQGIDCVMPIALLSGNQNTLNPYDMPMDRCMASAAGGTSHRLNPGGTMMRSLDNRPDMLGPPDGALTMALPPGRR